MRKAALVIVLVGCALGALVLGLARSSRGRAERAEAKPVDLVSSSGRRALDASGAEGASVDEKPSRVSTVPLATAASPLQLSAKVIVFDELEVAHEHENGHLAFTVLSGPSPSRHEVVVRDGRWSATFARSAGDKDEFLMSVGTCVLGGRRAVPDPRGERLLPVDGSFDLSLRWLPPTRLHVRARDTERELEEVFLCELPVTALGSVEDVERPSAERVHAARSAGPSPISLEQPRDALAPRVLFARSPGYAWGRIRVDPEAATEPVLFLEPAGALELVVRGAAEERRIEIELLAPGVRAETTYLDAELGEAKTFVLEDLPAGRFTARARDHGRPVGAVQLVVVAGERVTATLELGPVPTRLVPLEGVLELPEDAQPFSLDFSLEDRAPGGGDLSQGSFRIPAAEMVPEGGSRRRFRWAAPAVPPARYRVRLGTYATEVDTGREGTRSARITVPGVARVTVYCVDEQSGAEVESEALSFAPLTPRVFGLRSGITAREGRLLKELVLPWGPTLLLTQPNHYESAVRVLDVGPGTHEVVFHLRARAEDPLAPAQR